MRIIILLIFYSSLSHSNTKLDKILSKNKIAKEDIKFILYDPETSKIIEKSDPDTPMSLASVSKIFTTYYGLKNLGVDYRFQTKLYYTGNIKESKLVGDIYLVGGGAPFLVANNFVSFINKLNELGVKEVQGNFYVDGKKFAQVEQISSLGLEDQADNPSISGLNVEFNRFNVYLGSETLPNLKSISIEKTQKYKKGQNFIYKKDSKESWYLSSKTTVKKWEELPIKNSTLYAGNFFRYLSKLHGVTLPSPIIKKLPKNATLLFSHNGLALSKLSAMAMEYSNNLIAESILMAASNEATILKSAKKMHLWFKKVLKKVNWNHSTFVNGSGLTLENKASAKVLVDFLNTVKNETFDGVSFQSILSINGHSGGVRNRLKTPELAYRVYAKTGSLYFVNNITGYIIGKSNKKYIFAILITDKKKRELISQFPTKPLIRQSSLYYQKSQNVQDYLLEKWIKKY